jgi:proteasome accessory factor B
MASAKSVLSDEYTSNMREYVLVTRYGLMGPGRRDMAGHTDAFDEEPPPQLNSDDEQARRIAALLIDLSNTTGPVSTAELARRYHSDAARSSWDKLVSRDMEALARCGLIVRRCGHDEGRGTLWRVDDEASFADVRGLDQADARALSCALDTLVGDPSFAWSDELRIALAKLNRHFSPHEGIAGPEPAHPRQGRAVSTMAAALADSRAVDLSYRTAKGDEISRRVAPYGFFGLRGHLYFVAPRIEGDRVIEGTCRDYRADRIVRATEAKGAGAGFVVPADFDVRDHQLLPFQIGDGRDVEAVFLVPDERLRDVRHDAIGKGSFSTSRPTDGTSTWKVSARDLAAAASWSILEGIVPTAPAALVHERRRLLQGAAALVPGHVGARASRPVREAPSTAPQRGRRGGTETSRLMAALIGSLDDAGDEISAPVVAARLDVSLAQAEKLLYLIETTTTDADATLPVYADDAGTTLGLLSDSGVRGRPLRLSRHEARALLAALDYLGMPEDDRTRQAIMTSLAPRHADADELDALVSPCGTTGVASVVETCSRAIVGHRLLGFSYRGSVDVSPQPRRVEPRLVRQADGTWYLEAIDLDRAAVRTFRCDRMDSLDDAGPAGDAPTGGAPTDEREQRLVTLTFSDERYLSMFEWPGLEQVGTTAEGRVVATIAWYGTSWLVRSLCACGGDVTADDPGLVSLVDAWALEALEDAGPSDGVSPHAPDARS